MLQCVIAANQQEDLTNAINQAAETIQKAIGSAADEVAEDGLDDAANIVGQRLLALGSRISNAISQAGNTVVRDGLNIGADEITSAVQGGADEVANAIRVVCASRFAGQNIYICANKVILVTSVLFLCNFREKMSTTSTQAIFIQRLYCLKKGPQNRILKEFE
ncbi:hypothetical protein TNCT_4251 [Trichonephila clavata]|uniref:Uncharacterized protein n=1 Tax=Trichonephila clavata TaxID=2740835 RepID=A0A8X6FKR7_TRICU|nr:hypothetical protein TNCT_4251 [Trichonephila clavata]